MTICTEKQSSLKLVINTQSLGDLFTSVSNIYLLKPSMAAAWPSRTAHGFEIIMTKV